MLNWVLATESEYIEAGITPSPYERRWVMDTPNGAQEVILTHIQQYIGLPEYEVFVRKMPTSNYLSNDSLQYILPTEDEDGN